MNLTVLGAAGATGIPLVERALAAGHQVTGLARSAEPLATTKPGLRVVQGDTTDRAAVSGAMKGADAVVSVLGARGPVMARRPASSWPWPRRRGPTRGHAVLVRGRA